MICDSVRLRILRADSQSTWYVLNLSESMTLYRPVGLRELELIAESGFAAFPPRLPEQPIFYPVLNQEYAEQIAGDWNTKDPVSGYVGFVTAFDVDDEYLKNFERKVVGASKHSELWVPAEELGEFNRHITGPIRVVWHKTGEKFVGTIDEATHLPKELSN